MRSLVPTKANGTANVSRTATPLRHLSWEADRLLGEGADMAEVAGHLEVSEQTYHRWRNQYGGLKALRGEAGLAASY